MVPLILNATSVTLPIIAPRFHHLLNARMMIGKESLTLITDELRSGLPVIISLVSRGRPACNTMGTNKELAPAPGVVVKHLDTSVSILVILTSILFSATLVQHFFWHDALASRQTIVFDGKGEAEIVGRSILPFHSPVSKPGVILFISESCPFCLKGMPFYKTMAVFLHKSGFELVVVMPSEPAVISNFSRINGLIDAIPVGWSRTGSLDIKTTPRLLVFDAKGIIKASWTGLLNKPRQDEVADFLAQN